MSQKIGAFFYFLNFFYKIVYHKVTRALGLINIKYFYAKFGKHKNSPKVTWKKCGKFEVFQNYTFDSLFKNITSAYCIHK